MKNIKTLALCAALCVSVAAHASEKPKVTELGFIPTNVLIVGDSLMYYNGGINAWLQPMMRADGNKKAKARIMTVGGGFCTTWPVKEFLNPYTNNAHTDNAKAPDAVKAAEDKVMQKYDVVTLQGERFGEASYGLDEHYMPIHAKDIREFGATPVIMMGFNSMAVNTWGNLPAGIDEVVKTTVRTGNKLNAFVIPAGLAFANAQKSIKGLNLYQDDKRHPTAAGTYVMAATMYAAMYHKHPRNVLSFKGSGEVLIEDGLRAQLCDIAWETCKSFYGWKK